MDRLFKYLVLASHDVSKKNLGATYIQYMQLTDFFFLVERTIFQRIIRKETLLVLEKREKLKRSRKVGSGQTECKVLSHSSLRDPLIASLTYYLIGRKTVFFSSGLFL